MRRKRAKEPKALSPRPKKARPKVADLIAEEAEVAATTTVAISESITLMRKASKLSRTMPAKTTTTGLTEEAEVVSVEANTAEVNTAEVNIAEVNIAEVNAVEEAASAAVVQEVVAAAIVHGPNISQESTEAAEKFAILTQQMDHHGLKIRLQPSQLPRKALNETE